MRAWPSLKRPAPAFEPMQHRLFIIFVGTINKKTGGSKHMQLTYDPAKSLRNEAERGRRANQRERNRYATQTQS